MTYHTNKFSLSLSVSAFLLSGYAQADSANTINFQGEVSDETCSVAINGNESSPVVLLPTVSKADLDTSGKTAGKTDFTVGLTGCSGSATTTQISTVFVGNNVSAAGNLTNTGSAENVEIQMLDTAGTVINLTGGFTGSGDLSLSANETEKSATYGAQYFSTRVATSGTVAASIQYAITYR
ncbi:type 1 fimbrial protein [Pantoea ananatis]|uniref:fimbrial protein n=1 Tax=Pantoea ananas TaxID=553 RepID=UPI002222DA89|nr:fimbrial protein [Pantoea ananatis]MCW1833806.1 type 1 fimbrial protein [Pantoea ananatis]